MDELYLQDIYIYPIKSLGGISLPSAEVQQTGLQHDRRWMLVDGAGHFLSQRTFAQMALLQVQLVNGGLLITHKHHLLQPLVVPFNATTGKQLMVTIWDDVCPAIEVSAEANEWFSTALGMQAQLVYMPPTTRRKVEEEYAFSDKIVSFADAYPLMMIGQSSLDELNCRLKDPIKMNRFRPNFVFTGGTPYFEDLIASFQIGDVTFNAVKPCYRCVLTTINQEDGSKGHEPLKTLSTYRTYKNKIMFGQNLIQLNEGIVRTGEKLVIKTKKQPFV